jgi:hypothetical protein
MRERCVRMAHAVVAEAWARGMMIGGWAKDEWAVEQVARRKDRLPSSPPDTKSVV